MTASHCTVNGCKAKVWIRKHGLCKSHYMKQWHQGTLTDLRSYAPDRGCSVTGCKGGHDGFGFCKKHLAAWHAHGDPLKNLKTEKRSRIDELVAKAKTYTGDECLFWPYAKDRRGNPANHDQGVLSDLCRGRRPRGGFVRIEHTCRGGALCINPKHFHWAKFKPHASLTEADVSVIRASGKTQIELAKEFGISQSNVSAVLTGKTWKSVKPKGRKQ